MVRGRSALPESVRSMGEYMSVSCGLEVVQRASWHGVILGPLQEGGLET